MKYPFFKFAAVQSCIFFLCLSCSRAPDIQTDASGAILPQQVNEWCLSHHMRVALVLHKQRRPLYAEASNGETRAVSNALVVFSRFSPFLLFPLEVAALPFQRAGIPVFCDDIVSMAGAPKFRAESAVAPTDYKPLPKFSMVADMTWNFIIRGRTWLERELTAKLDEIAGTPNTHCFTRHIYESLLRSVRLWPNYAEAADAKGMALLNPLFAIFITTEISVLALSSLVDDMAFPAQKMGIPIVCGDIPVIPIP